MRISGNEIHKTCPHSQSGKDNFLYLTTLLVILLLHSLFEMVSSISPFGKGNCFPVIPKLDVELSGSGEYTVDVTHLVEGDRTHLGTGQWQPLASGITVN